MTQQQMKWAQRHDWFVGATPDGGAMVRERHNDAKNTTVYRTFTSFSAMREWAGY